MAEYPVGDMLVGCIEGLDSAELVNEGGQKAIYRATVDQQTVALKIVPIPVVEEDEIDTSSAAARVQREFEILEQVDVPVLAKSGPIGLGTLEIDGAPWMYFTEEWINGPTLAELVRDGGLVPHKVARLGLDLVDAVCWLSSRGLVHRDIKPSNVMWAVNRSRFVLLDPGIALDLYGPSLTKLPYPVGTVAYLSPEQMDAYQKRNLDFRSDLFAIGVVLYEAATGTHPFFAPGTTEAQLLAGILHATPQPVANVIEAFPQGMSKVIARFLGKQPHLRYRTCALARKALEEAAGSLETKL